MASKRMIAQFVEHWMSFSARKMSQDDVKHLTESYYTAFQGYTDTEIEFASKTYCETGEFFPPKPIHIISLIKNIQETKHSKELREMWKCKRCGEKTSSITSDGICLECAGVPKPAYKNLKPLPKPTPVNYKMEGRIKCQKCGKVEMCIQEPANTGQWLCRQSLLHLKAKGADGRTAADWVKLGAPRLAEPRRSICSVEKPLLRHGGIAVLKGNLAPISSLARMLNNTIPAHRGPARCFSTQEDAVAALKKGKVKDGEVLVVRYAGPRGAPGMPDTYALLATVVGMGLEGKLAVVTDGRFSGFARGLGVCQISPEAAIGGPLALVKDGDVISIDLPGRSLTVELSFETRNAGLRNRYRY